MDQALAMRVANFMDSRLEDLKRKGVLAIAPDIYNPGRAYAKVVHFSPYASDAALTDELRKRGIELQCYDPRPRHPLRALRDVVRIVRILRREHINIIRGRLPYAGSLIGCVAGGILGIPSVVSLGGDNRVAQELSGRFYFGSRMLSYGMEALVLRLCSRIIVPNRFTASYVARIIGQRARDKCVVIPWMIEEVGPAGADDAGLRARFGIAEDAQLVPIIGFLNRYKFTDRLYDALDMIELPRGPRPVFVFCGDGPLRADGERRFAGRADVRFIGWQERAVVASLLRAAAFVLVPMSGFVLLEAASAGKPVVTSRVEWHSELVADGKTGLLVDPEAPRQWADAILRMLAEPERAAEMARALGARYREEYRPERARALEIALYQELAHQGDAHAEARAQ
ncbi:MAG TPA: glycosyltransferase family 4 protein [Stellaceae bacterium]|nr:glycosyltransferase family 4 protein [Stellaceae bacterium]